MRGLDVGVGVVATLRQRDYVVEMPSTGIDWLPADPADTAIPCEHKLGIYVFIGERQLLSPTLALCFPAVGAHLLWVLPMPLARVRKALLALRPVSRLGPLPLILGVTTIGSAPASASNLYVRFSLSLLLGELRLTVLYVVVPQVIRILLPPLTPKLSVASTASRSTAILPTLVSAELLKGLGLTTDRARLHSSDYERWTRR